MSLFRYLRCEFNLIRHSQVKHLYVTGSNSDLNNINKFSSSPICTNYFTKNDYMLNPLHTSLLRWYQIRLGCYQVKNLCEPLIDLSFDVWHSGRNLLCLIHRYRPDLVENFFSLVQCYDNVKDKCQNSIFKNHDKCLKQALKLLRDYFGISFVLDNDLDFQNFRNFNFHSSLPNLVPSNIIYYPKNDFEWAHYLLQIFYIFSNLELPKLHLDQLSK